VATASIWFAAPGFGVGGPVGAIVEPSMIVVAPVVLLTTATRPSGRRTVCTASEPVASSLAVSASDLPVSPLTCATVCPRGR
jgi:hypothetical protein